MKPNLGITRPTHNWLDQAACARPDTKTENFFPHRDPQATLRALQICANCPITTGTACLTDALATEGISIASREGIRGGTTRRTRQRLYERITKSNRPAADLITEAITASAAKVTAPPKTLRSAYESRVIPGADGHVHWDRKTTSIQFKGRTYSAMALAFTVAHGRAPDGHVRATCGLAGCVAPEHLADAEMRKATA